jgi:diaminopimelate decarboxylase
MTSDPAARSLAEQWSANEAARRQGPLPEHLLPVTAETGSGGRLSIGGVDILDLVEQVGTPVFIYDEEHLRRRCQEVRQAFGPRTAYASKAFLCRAMAALAVEEGLCIDVSTGGELAVALAAGNDLCCTATTSPRPS